MVRLGFKRPSTAGVLSAVLVLTAAVVPAVEAADAYDYGFDVNARLARRADTAPDPNTPYVVAGAGYSNRSTSNSTFNSNSTTVSRVYPRQDIRKMEQDTDLWTLYMLGLSMMQYTPQSQMLSFYQLTGIHGVPWVSWNGVGPVKGGENAGYCLHISELFLPWHRPYLVLYEQALFDLVQYIASLYPNGTERTRYQRAAARFRIPYFDWGVRPGPGETYIPSSVGGSPVIDVAGPNGMQSIANPLYTYKFKPLNPKIFIEDPYDLWQTTVRAPTANDGTAGSNNSAVSAAFEQNYPAIQQRLYTLFSSYDNFSTFSNEAWQSSSSSSPDGDYDSLESLHDLVHGLMGLGGHMSWIPFSSFDPIFFLHHCMVDRLFAMWQVLHPDSYVLPTPAKLTSYSNLEGEVQTEQTPLKPFYKSADGTFWTSEDVRDMGVFGYTYDDMVDVPRASLYQLDTAAQKQVRERINFLYGTSSPATRKLGPGGQPAKPGGSGAHKGSTKPKPNTSLESPSVVMDNQYREWVANVHVPKMALEGSFSIDLFLGCADNNVPAGDASEWAFAPCLVGTMSVFASPTSPNMPAMDMSRVVTSGTVPLTSALASRVMSSELESLEPEAVEPYLHKYLRCGVVTADGRSVAPRDVPDLSVRVASSPVQVPISSDELPHWGPMTEHFDLQF